MTIREDRSELASESVRSLIEALHVDYGLSKEEILAGVHGELMRQMIDLVGCAETVRLIGKAAQTISDYAKVQPAAEALAIMGVMGRA